MCETWCRKASTGWGGRPRTKSSKAATSSGFGIGIVGRDVLNRHDYAAGVTVRDEGGRTDGFLAWAFSGLGRPT